MTIGPKCTALLSALSIMALGGCETTQTNLGSGSTMVTGSASGTQASGEAAELVRCDRPVGTAALVEPRDNTYTQLGLTSPVPLLRLMMAQSGCFLVVDRGAAAEALAYERSLSDTGELRTEDMIGRGQMVAADYVITPAIIFQDVNSSGGIGALGALLPGYVGVVASGLRVNNLEAQVTLFATNVSTGVQEAVAEGSARKTDIGFGAGGWAGGAAGVGGVYQDTDIGKITAAAFLDAHNNLVARLR